MRVTLGKKGGWVTARLLFPGGQEGPITQTPNSAVQEMPD